MLICLVFRQHHCPAASTMAGISHIFLWTLTLTLFSLLPISSVFSTLALKLRCWDPKSLSLAVKNYAVFFTLGCTRLFGSQSKQYFSFNISSIYLPKGLWNWEATEMTGRKLIQNIVILLRNPVWRWGTEEFHE